MWIYKLLETDIFPDWLIRQGIRSMLKQKIRAESRMDWEQQQQAFMTFLQDLKQSPIAIETDAANQQHYEVPPRFFELVLGPRLKYSACLWQPETQTLAEAEENMLLLTAERAGIQKGQQVLDLGCGWGSFSLWAAARYPDSRFVAVSNSRTQRESIERRRDALGLRNLEVQTANIVNFETDRQFDRIVSIEMFEHMKNYDLLLEKLSRFLRPDGKLFVHIFTHPVFAYHYEDKDGTDWLTRYFFTGGTMPSNHLLLYFQRHLAIANHWVVNGTHYQKTANAWIENMYRHRSEVAQILAETYGQENVIKWWVYWKVFFLACAEMWGYENGQQWFVSHYLFEKQPILAALESRDLSTSAALA